MSCVNVDPYTDLSRVLFRVDNIHCEVQGPQEDIL